MGGPFEDLPVVGHAAAASAAVVLSSSLTHPLDSLKTLLQVGASSKQKLGLSQVVERVRSMSGIPGLYIGLGWSIMGKIPGLGARFGTYELLGAFYKDKLIKDLMLTRKDAMGRYGREDNYVYVSESMLAGIAAGAVEAVVCTPFELVMHRKQVASTSPSRTLGPGMATKLLPKYSPNVKAWIHTIGLLSSLPTKHSNLDSALKKYPWMLTGSGKLPLASSVRGPLDINSLEGSSALWRGLRAGITRDSVYGGIFFSLWQFIHIGMLNWKALDINPPPSSINEVGPVSPMASSLAAGFSGAVAAAVSHSFDTAKTRSQCAVVPKYISMERKFLRWQTPGIWLERVTGTNPADRGILFRGIGLRMACSGLASFALVSSYLFAVQHLL
ncbi:putative envelope ADP,ATP carrier protein, chloroplastic [Apostasia shenzhenica]|uniref:Putative envelope ADP,ATP carrier protein, chloroplastic n=1 Tax=Apostasia shenzhenica TaxID=1088818 RepID=A0A2H9ZWJ6_9ASPA|nr:putative envelope ADP,ATP carrier protein, chloroplastic [Apostasia shenzhenica]